MKLYGFLIVITKKRTFRFIVLCFIAETKRTEQAIAREMAEHASIQQESEDIPMENGPNNESKKDGASWRDILKFKWAMFNSDDPTDGIQETAWGNALDLSQFDGYAQQHSRFSSPEQIVASLISEQDQPSKSAVLNPEEDKEMTESTSEALPTKSIVEEVELTVNCRVKTINFEGRADPKSINNLLEKVNPSRVVVVHSPNDAGEWLKKTSSNFTQCHAVDIPRAGETIELSTGAMYMEAVIPKANIHPLRFSKVGDYKVTFLSASLKADESKPASFELVPSQLTDEDIHPPLLLRDRLVPLTELKQKLDSQGVRTKFSDGALVVQQSSIIIRRHTHLGGISIEGPTGKEFNMVRDLLLRVHAVV